MELNGEIHIAATPDVVWDYLNNPEILKKCITGCESIEKPSDKEFIATVSAKIGPVSARFKGKVLLSDFDPPRSYTAHFEGQGGMSGFAKGDGRVKLSPEDGGARLEYSVKANVGGKLAQIGSRLIDSVAKANVEDFFSKFVQEICPPKAGEKILDSDVRNARNDSKSRKFYIFSNSLMYSLIAILLFIVLYFMLRA